MKVYIAVVGNFPFGMASAYRIQCYAKALHYAGNRCTIVSTRTGKKMAGKSLLHSDSYDDVDFKAILNASPFKGQILTHLWQELEAYFLLAYLLFRFKRFDTIWLYGMGFIPRVLLLLFMRLLKKKVVLELNEFPYATERTRLTKINWFNKLLQKLTIDYLLRNFNGIVAISESLFQVASKADREKKVLKVPILVDLEKRGGPNTDFSNGMPENYVFHAGSLSVQKDGIFNIVEAFILAHKQLELRGVKLKWVITNTASQVWAKIEKTLKEAGLFDHLIITGYLNEDELNKWMSHSRVLIINKPDSFQNKYNFPTKAGDYLLSGRPLILASADQEINRFISDGKQGLIVAQNDSKSLADSIVRLVLDPELAQKIGAEGRERALTSFDYRVHAERISTFFKNLA
ncbi:MAG: hypothetical protein DA405_06465 [Bacteroidetes bacterium]|nr:MAG: hypothetical protein DA405_06465 [Bacteroidota bacterium]